MSDSEAEKDKEGEGASLGDFTWVRLKRDSWWPAQVVDESCVSESVRPRPKSKRGGDVLLRLYGSHEFLYADPSKCRSEFESVIEREKLSCGDMFLKSLEKVLPSVKSARSKERASTKKAKALIAASTPDSVSNRLKHKSRSAADKARAEISRQFKPWSKSKELLMVDSQPCGDPFSNSKGKERKDSLDIGCSSKKKKAETPSQVQLLEGVRQLSTRRIRVMRNLGLISPLGSPFSKHASENLNP
ncbi:hypothetical protein MLD38_024671 [Melastoma candidum]|uniref:Uncharacterized protein n=1 Tax=Melastoma candidum TaxID=119954 RepID=A0ACB9NSZ5_9MYRT|nr:hypothetical protein MLD38_024671 [Melastoma candidum]